MKKDKSLIKPTDDQLRKQIKGRALDYFVLGYFLGYMIIVLTVQDKDFVFFSVFYLVIIALMILYVSIDLMKKMAKIRLEIREAIQCKSKKN